MEAARRFSGMSCKNRSFGFCLRSMVVYWEVKEAGVWTTNTFLLLKQAVF